MKSIQTYDWLPVDEARLTSGNLYFCYYERNGQMLMLEYIYEPASQRTDSAETHDWIRDGAFYKTPDLIAEVRIPPLPETSREMSIARPLEIEMEDGKVNSCTCPSCYNEQEIPTHLWNNYQAKRIECQDCHAQIDISIHASYQKRVWPQKEGDNGV